MLPIVRALVVGNQIINAHAIANFCIDNVTNKEEFVKTATNP